MVPTGRPDAASDEVRSKYMPSEANWRLMEIPGGPPSAAAVDAPSVPPGSAGISMRSTEHSAARHRTAITDEPSGDQRRFVTPSSAIADDFSVARSITTTRPVPGSRTGAHSL